MLPEYGTVDVGESRIALLDAGAGRPVLLIHGFGFNATSWHGQWTPLVEAGMRPIALDNPGFGRTVAGPGFLGRAEDYADLHAALLERLGIDGPVPVVGHSLGGGMALMLALGHPDRVSALVVVAPASEPSHSALRAARVARRDGFDEVAPIFFTRERLRRILLSAYGPNPPPGETLDGYIDSLRTSDAFGVIATFFSKRFSELRDRYREIRAPTLVVAGRMDPHGPPELSERPASAIPDATLRILPGLAHCPHEEDPAAFNAILLEFLATKDRARTDQKKPGGTGIAHSESTQI